MSRWRPRFRLRTLLALTAVCGVLLAPVAVEFAEYRREEAIIELLADAVQMSVPVDFEKVATIEVRFSRKSDIVAVGRGEAWFGLRNPVVSIAISESMFTPDQFCAMAELRSLHYLSVHSARIGKTELAAIAQIASLESIDLAYCQIESDELKLLAKLPKLKSLQLHNTGVSESAVIELQEKLPGLEVLDD